MIIWLCPTQSANLCQEHVSPIKSFSQVFLAWYDIDLRKTSFTSFTTSPAVVNDWLQTVLSHRNWIVICDAWYFSDATYKLLYLYPYQLSLTHWSRVRHICVSQLPIIGSDNGLSPGQRQVIIWANAGILLIRTLGINFSEILIEIHTFSFKKMYLKMSSGKWRPFCLGLNALMSTDVLALASTRSWSVDIMLTS